MLDYASSFHQTGLQATYGEPDVGTHRSCFGFFRHEHRRRRRRQIVSIREFTRAMSGERKHDFQRDFLILVGVILLILGALLTPARKWFFWSSEQRAVESYIQASMGPGEEWEIISWQAPVNVHKTPGADRAIWCHYKSQKQRDKVRHAKGIFYLKDGKVQRLLPSDDRGYVEAYTALWGEPKFLADIMVADSEKRAQGSGGYKPAEPNWDEPPTAARMQLCLKLIRHWQQNGNGTDIPSTEAMLAYLKSLPISVLVGLGEYGNCFLDREILKKEWEESGKKNPWLYPTFLHREDVLVSADDKKPFVFQNEAIKDLLGASHDIYVREAEGTVQKQPGGLPSVRLVWVGGLLGARRITLPGDPAEWKIALSTSPSLEKPAPKPPTAPVPTLPVVSMPASNPLKLLEFKILRGTDGAVTAFKGRVLNQSDKPVEDAWAKILTPFGPISAPVTPRRLKPGGDGIFSRKAPRGSSAVRYRVDLVIGQPKS